MKSREPDEGRCSFIAPTVNLIVRKTGVRDNVVHTIRGFIARLRVSG